MRKKSSGVDEDKKEKIVKLSDYVPEGDLNIFITQLITFAVNKLIE